MDKLNLKELRRAKGISLYRLARNVGMHVSAVQRLERYNYEKATIKTLLRVVDGLGCKLVVTAKKSKGGDNKKRNL